MNGLLALLAGIQGYGGGRQQLLAKRQAADVNAATAAQQQANLDRTFTFDQSKQQQQALLDQQKEADQRAYWDSLAQSAEAERAATERQRLREGGAKFPEFIAGVAPDAQPASVAQFNQDWKTNYPIPFSEASPAHTVPGTPGMLTKPNPQAENILKLLMPTVGGFAGAVSGMPYAQPPIVGTPDKNVPATYFPAYGPGPKDAANIQQSLSAAHLSDVTAGTLPINADTARIKAATDAQAAQWLHNDKALELKLKQYGIDTSANTARLGQLIQKYGIDTTANTAANADKVRLMLGELSAQTATRGQDLTYKSAMVGKGITPQIYSGLAQEKGKNLTRLTQLSGWVNSPKASNETAAQHAANIQAYNDEITSLRQRNTEIDRALEAARTTPFDPTIGVSGIKMEPLTPSASRAYVGPASLGPAPRIVAAPSQEYTVGKRKFKVTPVK
jgi:hypothetical protein